MNMDMASTFIHYFMHFSLINIFTLIKPALKMFGDDFFFFFGFLSRSFGGVELLQISYHYRVEIQVDMCLSVCFNVYSFWRSFFRFVLSTVSLFCSLRQLEMCTLYLFEQRL